MPWAWGQCHAPVWVLSPQSHDCQLPTVCTCRQTISAHSINPPCSVAAVPVSVTHYLIVHGFCHELDVCVPQVHMLKS